VAIARAEDAPAHTEKKDDKKPDRKDDKKDDDRGPRPPPEMDGLKKLFGGSWRCEGRMLASPIGPEHATRASSHGKLQLDGFWIVIEIEERKTSESPHPIRAEY